VDVTIVKKLANFSAVSRVLGSRVLFSFSNGHEQLFERGAP
jgi:hypothetical protein